MDTKQKMTYIIIGTKHFYLLEGMVNEYLSMGYTCVGGPFINLDNSLCQAMITDKVIVEKKTKERKTK